MDTLCVVRGYAILHYICVCIIYGVRVAREKYEKIFELLNNGADDEKNLSDGEKCDMHID